MRKFTIVLLLSVVNLLHAVDEITVINHVSKPLYAALYYVKTNIIGADLGPANRVGDVQAIQQDQKIQTMRPPSKKGMRRELIFSFYKDDLAPEINVAHYKQRTKTPAGRMHGKIFHIDLCDDRLCSHTEVSWKLIKPVKDLFKTMSDKVVDNLKQKFLKHNYATAQATVRVGTTLASQEVVAVNKRFARAKTMLEKRIGAKLKDNEMPRIAICMSGGGMRAVMCSFGFIAGLDDIGLLDTVIYAAALSGSTWLLTHYLTLGMPMNEYKEELIKGLTQMHLLDPSVVSEALWKKLIFGQEIGIVDLYGVYLANKLFRNITNDANRQKVLLTDLAKRMENGDWFFPLCTAIETTFDYNWFTFTPYEIGSEQTGIFIPPWAFGRKFADGKSVDFAPEPSLGYFMGLWGSALSGTIGDMLLKMNFAQGLPKPLAAIVREIIYSVKADNISFSHVKVFNMAKGLQGLYRDNKRMTFIDAGYSFNVPFPPLLNKERAIDIMIVLDVSDTVHKEVSELREAQQYAHAKDLPFPPIDYADLNKRFISVFSDKNDPRCPTIIYIIPVKYDTYDSQFDPAKAFEKTYASTRFPYNRADVEKLSGLIRKEIVDNKEIIMKVINDKIKQKSKEKVTRAA